MPIRVLDASTIGKISAGEVVERPASAAKELIENALDAGSTAITIEVKDGGNTYLRVTDNGCGIPANEVRMAFENHATSKLSGEQEISAVRTLGFRGEALPSIAAVSKVEMTTRQRGQDTGMRINVEGGKVTNLREAGCPEGTTVIMRDIFYNTPVRRAFLKKGSYEFSVIAETVSKMILGNPKVGIRLLNNGKTVYHSFGDGQLRHAVLAVYGRETAEKVIEIDESEGGMRLHGVIGVGELAKPTRSHQTFFINGRTVRCPILQRALEEAVRGRVMIGQYPMCALSIQLAPTNVDVNVHPNKLEVRFRDESAVRTSMEALLNRALNQEAMLSAQSTQDAPTIQQVTTVTRMNADAGEQQSLFENKVRLPDALPAKPVEAAAPARTAPEPQSPPVATNPQRTTGTSMLREGRSDSIDTSKVIVHDVQKEFFAPVQQTVSPKMTDRTAAPEKAPTAAERTSADPKLPPVQPSIVREQPAAQPPKPALPHYRIVGTLFQTYILLEFQDSILLIDQHAAHERLRFEQYKKLLDTHSAAQQLLTPIVLSVSPKEMVSIENNRELLMECGYEVEPFGDRDIRVLSVPHILGRADTRMVFMEIIDQLDQLKNVTRDTRLAEIIQMSCKHAVKAGDTLSAIEIDSLIAQMLETGAPPTCPHGRPVLHKLTRRDLEHMFKRIQ